ncbi:hypothetical protein ACFX2H_013227 [Malus domestica]
MAAGGLSHFGKGRRIRGILPRLSLILDFKISQYGGGPARVDKISGDVQCFLDRLTSIFFVATYWHYHDGCLVGQVVDGGFRVKMIDAYALLMDPLSVSHQGPILKPEL